MLPQAKSINKISLGSDQLGSWGGLRAVGYPQGVMSPHLRLNDKVRKNLVYSWGCAHG
jgi:hypothetical protein